MQMQNALNWIRFFTSLRVCKLFVNFPCGVFREPMLLIQLLLESTRSAQEQILISNFLNCYLAQSARFDMIVFNPIGFDRRQHSANLLAIEHHLCRQQWNSSCFLSSAFEPFTCFYLWVEKLNSQIVIYFSCPWAWKKVHWKCAMAVQNINPYYSVVFAASRVLFV